MAVRLKSWNWFTLAVGRPGSGKSYHTRRMCWAEAQRVGAYTIVHDPTWSYSEDRSIPVRRYQTVLELGHGLGKEGGRVAHVLDVADADTVLRAGVGLGKQCVAAAKGGLYHPVMIVVDEAVGASGIQPHGLSPFWREAIAQRRHWGIGVSLTAQSAHFVHRSVAMLSTRLDVFALSDPADGKRLVAAGLEPELADKLRELPDRKFHTIVGGRTVGAARAGVGRKGR